MTKSLSEIQKENRKFILEAIHGCSYEEALKKEYAKKGNNTISVPLREYDGEELTLSRVLLALPSELYYYKSANWLYIAKPNQDPKEQITWGGTYVNPGQRNLTLINIGLGTATMILSSWNLITNIKPKEK